MFSKKKFILITRINILFITLLVLIKLLPVTLSKYQSSGIGNMNSNIAFYLINVSNLSETIRLDNLKPRDLEYVYNFSVSNKKDDILSEVDIEYLLSIVTTTNLPLRYELYENCDYELNSCNNLISDNNTKIVQDSDNTYFKEFTLKKEEMYFSKEVTNNYTLVVYFDLKNNDAKYQDSVELVEINVDSSQIIDS